MRPARAWRHLRTDTVTIASLTGQDGYGDPTYGTAVRYPARVVGEQKLIRGFNGEEVVTRFTAYVLAPVVVQPTARIVLSTAAVGSTEATATAPPLLGSKQEPDQSGVHHAVLYFG